MPAPATLRTVDGDGAAQGIPRGSLRPPRPLAVPHVAELAAQHRILRISTHSLGIARWPGFVPRSTSLAVRLRDT